MTPVANQIQPVQSNGMDMYSKMLGLQQQQQALQIGAATLQGAQAESSMKQRVAQERQSLAQVNWRQFEKEDGSFDEDGIQKTALAVAPTTGAEFASHLLQMTQGSAETKKAWLGLDNETRNNVRSIFGAFAADPNAKPGELASELQEYRDSLPADLQKRADTIIDHTMRNMGLAQSPDAQRRIATEVSRAGLSQSELSGPGGMATPATGTANVGGAILPTSQNRVTGAMSVPSGGLRTGLAPGVTILTDANGRQYRYNTQSGQIEGQVGAPAAGATQGQGGFTQPVPNQPAVQQEIMDTRRADADYGVNRHVNDQIIRLSNDTSTGPGTDIWHHALGAVAGPLGGNNVSDYQTIGAYLDRQAALSAKQMGLPDTNAGLATAASLSGTTNYQPKALQTKVKLTDALVEGAHQYREGLDKVVGTGPNQDLSKYQAYRAAWASNFDPNVFRAENALRRGDKEELAQIKKEVGPKGMAELKRKSDNLRLLSQGQIPQ